MTQRRDVAVVLSGGSMNGILMELGFLRRLRESELWPRVGWFFGTSSGALAGSMGALDRLDDLESFLLRLQPEETFRPNRLWRLPLLGVHEYALPETIAERLGDFTEVARQLKQSERELVVVATDVTPRDGIDEYDYELVYSAWRTEPEEFAQAILASAAISALVLPVRVGPRIATDGAWVRNFPLAHAYSRPGVRMIVAFRFVPHYPHLGASGVAQLRKRLAPFGRIAPVRALIGELRAAEAREARGEPAHFPEMILRLTRAAIVRNTVIEEQLAADKDESIREFERLRVDLRELVTEHVRGRRERERVLAALDDRLGSTRFPFRHDRAIPRITVRGSVAEVSLDPGRRDQQSWSVEAKRSLIERGYEYADEEFARAGLDLPSVGESVGT